MCERVIQEQDHSPSPGSTQETLQLPFFFPNPYTAAVYLLKTLMPLGLKVAAVQLWPNEYRSLTSGRQLQFSELGHLWFYFL